MQMLIWINKTCKTKSNSSNGETALIKAVESVQTDIVKMLIDAKADLDKQNR